MTRWLFLLPTFLHSYIKKIVDSRVIGRMAHLDIWITSSVSAGASYQEFGRIGENRIDYNLSFLQIFLTLLAYVHFL